MSFASGRMLFAPACLEQGNVDGMMMKNHLLARDDLSGVRGERWLQNHLLAWLFRKEGISMIFGHVLKKHISMNPVISGLLLSGVVICVYCISIMLGLAVGQYQLATCSNTEASLTIDIDGKNGVNMDELSAYLNSISKKGMVNVLYFTRLESKKILVGWDGTKGNNWFPITSGNFLTKRNR